MPSLLRALLLFARGLIKPTTGCGFLNFLFHQNIEMLALLLALLIAIYTKLFAVAILPPSPANSMRLSADGRNATQRSLSIGVMTWNMAEKSPSEDDCQFMKELTGCDVVALGIQECEDLRPRRRDGRRSRRWRELHRKIFKKYECLAAHKMGGLQLVLYAKKGAAKWVQGVQTIEVACGIGNVLSNKGAICMLLRLKGSKTLALVNAHLAAHQHQVAARNADYHRIASSILERSHRKWQRRTSTPSDATSWTERMHGIIFFGDLNYRIKLPRLEIELHCEDEGEKQKRTEGTRDGRLRLSNAQELLDYDQLTAQIRRRKAFSGFQEASILFPPTFKYTKGSERFDRRRAPAYTDRVLYHSHPSDGLSIHPEDYYCVDARHSDHRPVCGRFSCTW